MPATLDYLSRLRTVWRMGHDADWEAGTTVRRRT